MKSAEHYEWVAAILAEAGGLHPVDARYIATYSQTVDECRPDRVPARVPVFGPCPVITQSYDYKFFRSKKLWDIHAWAWVRFHFGGPDAYAEGRACREGDGRRQLEDAFAELKKTLAKKKPPSVELLARAGIATHVFFDSFAHQGFRGWRDNRNASSKFFEWLTPDIGHADFGSAPDEVGKIWVDQAGRQIKNRDRFARCGIEYWAIVTGEEPERVPDGSFIRVRHAGKLIAPRSLNAILLAKNEKDLADRCRVIWSGLTRSSLPRYKFPADDVMVSFYRAAADW